MVDRGYEQRHLKRLRDAFLISAGAVIGIAIMTALVVIFD